MLDKSSKTESLVFLGSINLFSKSFKLSSLFAISIGILEVLVLHNCYSCSVYYLFEFDIYCRLTNYCSIFCNLYMYSSSAISSSVRSSCLKRQRLPYMQKPRSLNDLQGLDLYFSFWGSLLIISKLPWANWHFYP